MSGGWPPLIFRRHLKARGGKNWKQNETQGIGGERLKRKGGRTKNISIPQKRAKEDLFLHAMLTEMASSPLRIEEVTPKGTKTPVPQCTIGTYGPKFSFHWSNKCVIEDVLEMSLYQTVGKCTQIYRKTSKLNVDRWTKFMDCQQTYESRCGQVGKKVLLFKRHQIWSSSIVRGLTSFHSRRGGVLDDFITVFLQR